LLERKALAHPHKKAETSDGFGKEWW